MGAIEYRKIIDVMAGSLTANKSMELNYAHDSNNKIDVIDVAMTTASGEKIDCRVNLRPNFLEFTFDRKFFTPAKYEKFLSRFEYDMEQSFMRNIHLERADETHEYRIRIQQ
jgi:hypothetical protein